MTLDADLPKPDELYDRISALNPGLDAKQLAIAARLAQPCLSQQGPEVGYFIRLKDGSLTRFTHKWEHGLQTEFGGSSSFYLGDGYVSHSGGLDSVIANTAIQPTGETLPGVFWFFKDNQRGAGRNINVNLPCPVFQQI